MIKLKLATRNSPLALAQSYWVIDLLQQKFPDLEIEIVPIASDGDQDRTTPLTSFSQTGIFVKKLEETMLRHEADFAVHSLKDLPSPIDERFVLMAYLKRERVNDVLVSSRSFPFSHDSSKKDSNKQVKEKLLDGKYSLVIGTSSRRRAEFLKASYKSWAFTDIRGNVDTRLKKLKSESAPQNDFDAIVLSEAGLFHLRKRLLLSDYRVERIPTSMMVPAAGQGCVVVECLQENYSENCSLEVRQRMIGLLRSINHIETERAVNIERKIMESFGGGCHIPFGCFARIKNKKIQIDTQYFVNEKMISYSIKGDVERAEEYARETIMVMKQKEKAIR